MDYGLKDKVVFITGADKGLGREIAKQFAIEGAQLFLCARNYKLLSSVKKDLTDYGVPVEIMQIDLSKTSDIDKIAELQFSDSGLDIFIGNAAATSPNHFLDLDEETWDYILNVNLKANFILLKRLAPQMQKKGSGRIIFISSVVAFSGGLGKANIAYTCSKSALLGMTKNLAKYFAPYGITVNSVAPSFVMTDMLSQTGFSNKGDELANLSPLKRLGTEDDVAKAVLFLASNGASYITGQTIHVNGGYLMC